MKYSILLSDEISALIMAMHKMQQRQLPLVLIGAGLPILPGLAGESKSYAERLFHFPVIGPLSGYDTEKALKTLLSGGDCILKRSFARNLSFHTRLSLFSSRMGISILEPCY